MILLFILPDGPVRQNKKEFFPAARPRIGGIAAGLGAVYVTVGLTKEGSFVVCMTQFRTWIATGAFPLHRSYPADSRNCKYSVYQTFSVPILL